MVLCTARSIQYTAAKVSQSLALHGMQPRLRAHNNHRKRNKHSYSEYGQSTFVNTMELRLYASTQGMGIESTEQYKNTNQRAAMSHCVLSLTLGMLPVPTVGFGAQQQRAQEASGTRKAMPPQNKHQLSTVIPSYWIKVSICLGTAIELGGRERRTKPTAYAPAK